MKLPRLYKKSSKGATLTWEIESINNTIVTRYGQMDSENIQHTLDYVDGKNVGKTNETTAKQQAVIKAKQLWDKKIKSGYVDSLEKLESGEENLPAFSPMLAYSLDKYKHKVMFPCISMPKLDGVKILGEITETEVKLYTRTRKPITVLPHIEKALREFYDVNNLKGLLRTDGEGYNHDFKNDLGEITSRINRNEVHPDAESLEYHIYDLPSYALDGVERMLALTELMKNVDFIHITPIRYDIVNTFKEIDILEEEYISDGYEGQMLKMNTPYVNIRTPYLLKNKRFEDKEFEILDILEGSGRLIGCAAKYVCSIDGKIFRPTAVGPRHRVKQIYENKKDIIGKMLTVNYFGFTPDGIPRHPRGKIIRDYE